MLLVFGFCYLSVDVGSMFCDSPSLLIARCSLFVVCCLLLVFCGSLLFVVRFFVCVVC